MKQASQPFAEGLENVAMELAALDRAAKDGKADLSKIQIEGVTIKVVKDTRLIRRRTQAD